MSLIVQIDDFKVGQTKLAMDKYTKIDLQAYIDKYEVEILQDLLGCDLYEDFVTDWNAAPPGEPTAAKFKEIYEPFCIDDSLCYQRRSLGIKEMLKLMIYFYYLRDTKPKNNIGGVHKNLQSNSEEASFHETNIYTNYNEGIVTYWSIQWIICDNPNGYDWDKFNGVKRQLISIV